MRIETSKTGRSWDSVLYIDPGLQSTLTLNFRVKLIPIQPGDRSQGGINIKGGVVQVGKDKYQLLPWETYDWNQFQGKFPFVVENAWSDRLWLHPNMAWYQSNPNDGFQAKILGCRLNIRLNDNNPHATFRCLRVQNGVSNLGNEYRSWASWDERRGVITHLDLLPEKYFFYEGDAPTKGHPTNITPYECTQTTVAHEFGHILRLGHVREGLVGCVKDTNTTVCYGRIHQERDDIMGYGDKVLPSQGKPWTRTLQLHLHPEYTKKGQKTDDFGVRWTPKNTPDAGIYDMRGHPSKPGSQVPTPL